MADLFSLRRRSEEETEIPHSLPSPFHPDNTIFWYNSNNNNNNNNNNNKNDDSVSTYRGFEIWNQQQQQQQQHQFMPLQHEQQQNLYSSAGVMLGVGPSADKNRSAAAFVVASGSGSNGGISCQDCGNQAKKDCPHVRCRTCCKSRGFDCQTHVKSTWVPAARRRQRQQQLAAAGGSKPQQHGEDDDEEDEDIVPEIRRRRDLNNNNNNNQTSLACTRIPSSNPSLTVPAPGLLEEVNFPAVVNSPAEFRCVRVSSVEEGEEEYAYSTAVNIGGHVFRGILYDYGPADHHGNNSNYNYNNMGVVGNNSSGGGGGEVAVQPLNLISGGVIVDPSSLYPAPLNTFMPSSSGTQFFPHPRS